MEDNLFDNFIREDIDVEITRQIHKCFLKWGAEGTLEKIETIYSHMPELKERWLTQFWKIVGRQNGT